MGQLELNNKHDLLPSQLEMGRLDTLTIQSGVSSKELMERAGRSILAIARAEFSPEFSSKKGAVVLCGPGNNGGDGFVIAIGAIEAGKKVTVILIEASKYSEDLLQQMRIFLDRGGIVKLYSAEASRTSELTLETIADKDLINLFNDADIVFDALLGTGQRKDPTGNIAKLIKITNCSREDTRTAFRLIAVDLPTGINCDTGEVYDPSFQADLTVTVQFVKRGLTQYPAKRVAGKILTVDVGINGVDGVEFRSIPTNPVFWNRRAESHKGDNGTVYIVGGSSEMPGAPTLAAHAALRAGAGIVRKIDFVGDRSVIWPEVILDPLKGALSSKHFSDIIKQSRDSTVTVIGPGVGQCLSASKLIVKLLKATVKDQIQTVIDADALNIISKNREFCKKYRFSNAVMTPHPGEAARLLNSSTLEIQRDRFSAARELASRYGAVVVLKGASTIVYAGNKGWVCEAGNPFMATAGSGDVLSGIIASFIAQGNSLEQGALLGVALHAAAGDRAFKIRKGPIIASDIIEEISGALI